MKQLFFLIFLISFQCLNTFGQSKNDSIMIDTTRSDIKCYKNGKFLTEMDYNYLFKNNPTALHEMKLARANYKAGMTFGYIGGFTFGFCLGSLIKGDHIDYTWWLTIGTSAAIAGTGLLIYNAGKKHHRNAVKEYNSTLGTTAYHVDHTLEFGPTNHGLGFAYNF